MIVFFSELLSDSLYNWHVYFIGLKSKGNLTVLEARLLQSYRFYVPEVDNYCCCDTIPVKNCSLYCCVQFNCNKCSRVVRICRDGWKIIDKDTVLCMNCYKK